MVSKADGQRIVLKFDNPILGDISSTHTSSGWIPSAFQITFYTAQYASDGVLYSVAHTPNSVSFAQAFENSIPLESGISSNIDYVSSGYDASNSQFYSMQLKLLSVLV